MAKRVPQNVAKRAAQRVTQRIAERMAKRNASFELNRDNWDELDEEEEKTGARVVKKAKRRNLTKDQKKNVFQGVGVLTSSNKTAEEAFSSLGKPQEATEEEDTKAAKEEAPKRGDLMAKFMVKSESSWSCSVCMISNSSNKSKCDACEAPKPGGEKPVDVPAGPKDDDLMAKFITKSAVSWSCGVCMISNAADKSKCAACEAPNPKAAAPKSDNLMAKLMTKSESEPAKPTFNIGCNGGFKFVDANASSAKAESPFKFVGSEPDAADSASKGGGFKFRASKPAAEGGFTFGASAESPPALAPASGFSSGTGGIVGTPGKGGFTFSTKKVSEGPVTATPSGKARPDWKEYLADLNTEAEKGTLADALREAECEVLQLQDEVKAGEAKVQGLKDQGGVLERRVAQGKQELLSARAEIQGVKERAREMLLAQDEELSQASLYIGRLQGRLEALLGEVEGGSDPPSEEASDPAPLLDLCATEGGLEREELLSDFGRAMMVTSTGSEGLCEPSLSSLAIQCREEPEGDDRERAAGAVPGLVGQLGQVDSLLARLVAGLQAQGTGSQEDLVNSSTSCSPPPGQVQELEAALAVKEAAVVGLKCKLLSSLQAEDRVTQPDMNANQSL